MNFFKRNKKEDEKLSLPIPATSRSRQQTFFSSFSPISRTEYELYSSLRESVPVIDAALEKTVRLMGDFKVMPEDKSAQRALDNFLNSVPTTGGNRGIYPFITTFFNELLTYGEAVGEIVLSGDNSRVAALYNASLKDVQIRAGSSPLELVVCQSDGTPAPCQRLIIPALLNPQPGTVRGTSVLRGLPFVSGILLKIFESVGKNWERVGNVRFAVTYRPDSSSGSVTQQQAEQIADEWSKAMRSSEVCDFVSVGDVNVKVIGADNQVLDCDIPVRHLMEQIIAKLGLPPFVLGISWSTSERMSTQQADILTSELEFYRTLLTPVIIKVCKTFLRLSGYDDGVEVSWGNINLQDEVELSQARLNNAKALQIEKELGVSYEDETVY